MPGKTITGFVRYPTSHNPVSYTHLRHYGTNMMARAIFGGDCYLDGYSIYDSPKGYKHIVTFGMTELYADEESFGGEWNKWGYEMTIKLREKEPEDCLWAIDVYKRQVQ